MNTTIMQEKLILRCEDTLDGIFTAIYDAFVYKKQIGEVYNDSISIAIGEEGELTLFSTEIEVQTDPVKAQKTIGAIQRQLGGFVYERVFHALCHYDSDRATIVLGFLVRGFKKGPRVEEEMADPYVMRVLELSRKVYNEEQLMDGFLRFSDNGKFLYSAIEPKCDLIPVIMWHFADRYPGENFVILDSKRRYGVVHSAGKGCFYISGEDFFEIESSLPKEQDEFELMWKEYFKHMEIKERHNENCQRNLCPKWYRKNMLEFDKEQT